MLSNSLKWTPPLALLGVMLVCALAPNAHASPGDWSALMRSLGEPRDGDIVVEQLPAHSGGYGADTAFRDYVGRPIWQQIADNLLLSETTTIQRVEWYGFYGGPDQNHFPPAGDETMRLRFYSARPGDGLPGDVLCEESYLNPSRLATGVIIDGNAPEYLFGADLSSPVSLVSTVPYWLEIVQVGDLESHFRWEDGYGLVPECAGINNLLPDWELLSDSGQAFRLLTVPEPSALVLLVAASALIATGRRRKEGDMDG